MLKYFPDCSSNLSCSVLSDITKLKTTFSKLKYIVYDLIPNHILSFRACCRTYKINSMHQMTFRNMQSISLCMQTSLVSRPLSKMLMLMKTSIQVNNSLNIYSSLYQMQKNVTNRPVGRSKVRGKIHLLIRSCPRLMLEKC